MKELKVIVENMANPRTAFNKIILEDTPREETLCSMAGNPVIVKKYTALLLAAESMKEALEEILTEYNRWTSMYEGEGIERVKRLTEEALAKTEVK